MRVSRRRPHPDTRVCRKHSRILCCQHYGRRTRKTCGEARLSAKKRLIYQECLDAVPEEINAMASLEVEFSNFFSLVKRKRKAQKDVIYKSMFSALDSARPTAYEVAKTKQIVLEQEVDEYLKKMEEEK